MGTIPEKQAIFFRNHLHHTGKKHYSKAWAFSPDIIPHYEKIISADTLISSYKDFIAFHLRQDDLNFIYLRAFAPQNPVESTAVTLRAIPSELILWPQIWNETPILSGGPIVISADGVNDKPVANDEHLVVHPPTLGGFSYSLIAVSQSIDPSEDYTTQGLREILTVPPAAHNWRDLAKFIEEDRTTNFYNVRVADPTSPCISITTRLRFFENSEDIAKIKLQLRIVHTGLPADAEVSLSSDHGDFILRRIKIDEKGDFVGSEHLIAKNYDGFVTLNIFPPLGGSFSHGWISLQAHVVVPRDNGNNVHKIILLGAETVIFDASRCGRPLRGPGGVAGGPIVVV